MDEVEARLTLKGMIGKHNELEANTNMSDWSSPYIRWKPGQSEIVVDGVFTLDELQAVAWWIANKQFDTKIG